MDIDLIPDNDIVLSNLSPEEKAACNLALKNISNRGEDESL